MPANATKPERRGGPGRGQGRKPIGPEPMQRRTVTLPHDTIRRLERLGDGNVSAGIRAIMPTAHGQQRPHPEYAHESHARITDKLIRVVRVASLLHEEPGQWDRRSLAEVFGVTERTMARDIDAIRRGLGGLTRSGGRYTAPGVWRQRPDEDARHPR